MRRLSRTIAIAGALAAVMALGSASMAVAAPLGGGVDSTRWVSVSVNGDGAGGGGGSSGCSWRKYAGEIDSSYANKYDLPSYQANKDKPGDFYWVECGSDTDLLYVPDSVPVVDPFVMAQYALSFITGQQATVNINPTNGLVQMPTWFWVDANAGTITATAEVINETATVVATPARVIFKVNGESFDCDYPGRAFVVGRDDPLKESPTGCSKTFTQAVEGAHVTAQIVYTVTWSATGAQPVPTSSLGDLFGPVSPVTNFNVLQAETINQ